jgi:NAD(P)-dependent dehydrogenase (short-subunit alcohol dehydrogenase family)
MADTKVAMIVGGGSGMGAAAARKLAADGFAVAVLSSSGKGEALGKELGGIGFTGSITVVMPGVLRPARSTADFTCAEAIGTR